VIPKRTLIPLFLLSSTPALAKPPPDEQAPKELLALRGELFDAGEEGALRQIPRFRPLCDADGYPLVGNVVRKTNLFQPSRFCAHVRARESKA
jgi:hypothetical protein